CASISDSLKEEPEFNQRLLRAAEGYIQNSTRLTEIANSLRAINFPSFQDRITAIENTQLVMHANISSIKGMVTEMFQTFKGFSSSTPSGSSSILTITPPEVHATIMRGDNSEKQVVVNTTKEPEFKMLRKSLRLITKPALEVEMIGSSSRLQLINTILEVQIPQPEPQHTTSKPDKGKGKATESDESPKKLVKASTKVLLDPDAPAHMEMEERKEKATQEANLLALTKLELIKVVHEEATKAGVDPKALSSKKGGQVFLKIQDFEIKVLNREHSKKIKKEKQLRKKRIDQYRWTISSRLKPKIITDIHIHPNTKPVAIIVFRVIDKRNFDVHKPFKFGDFGRNRKHQELEHEVRIPRLECNRSLPEGVSFVNNLVIEQPENGTFFIDVFGDEAFQRMSDIQKVDVDSLLSYLVMDLKSSSTPTNQRLCAALRSLIDIHPDKKKLK
ncbi:hypothetical protein Tco_1077749, partial [Tanacetum coccineum]